MRVVSAHSIRLGAYDGQEAEVFMDNEGKIFVRIGFGPFTSDTDTLKRLLMDSITAEALLRKHVD